MAAEGVLHIPIGAGLPGLALPYLAFWLAPLGGDTGYSATGECHFVDPAGRPALSFPLPEGAEIISWPAAAEFAAFDQVGVSEAVRAAAERYARDEYDPGIRLAALGVLWTGPLCLTHEEGLALLRAAAASEGPKVQAWAVYLAEEYYRVEAGRDALAAGDWAAFGRLVAESSAAYGEVTGSWERGAVAERPTWHSADEPGVQTAIRWPGSPPLSAPSGAVKRRFAKP